MRKATITALALLSACAPTVADLRDGPAFLSLSSQKPVSELSGCLGSAWQHRSGMVGSVPRTGGVTLTLSYPVMGQTLVAAAVDIDDRGDSRSVLVHARKGDAGQKLRSEVEGCV